VVITCRRLQDVKELFASPVEQTKKMGLEINGIKVKFMTASRKPYNRKEFVKLYTHNIETVRHYTDIGTIQTYKNEVRPEIEKNKYKCK
jgi:hypothetical protein